MPQKPLQGTRCNPKARALSAAVSTPGGNLGMRLGGAGVGLSTEPRATRCIDSLGKQPVHTPCKEGAPQAAKGDVGLVWLQRFLGREQGSGNAA